MRRITTLIALLAFGIMLLCLLVSYINFLRQADLRIYAINEVASEISSGRIETIIVEGDKLHLVFMDGSEALAYKSPDSSLGEQLRALGVSSDVLSPENLVILERPSNPILSLATWAGYSVPFLIVLVPILLLVWYVVQKRRIE